MKASKKFLVASSVFALNMMCAAVAFANYGSGSIAWSDDEATRQVIQSTQPLRAEVSRRETTLAFNNNGVVASNYNNSGFNNNYSAYEPTVNARAAIVMDAQTGEILFSKNTGTSLPIASITKLMTAVVTADARLDMSERIMLEPIDFAGAGGKNSSSTLRAGDVMNRAELLLAALMKSENPAAAALARAYPGGRGAFVAQMNAKARQLGMTSTRYVESTGLDPQNMASARDLALLVSAASQYGLIRQFSTTPNYDFNIGRSVSSRNTNALVRAGSWNIGLSKTGYIRESGRCVVMEATVNNRPAVVVLLGASDTAARNSDAESLLSWLSARNRAI
ncbi:MULTISPECIES: D-alanyl-D-alanine carboxypeptidase family protein [unclassified Acinetobacter]|uniref:D-alanyl-D-alanine carboxypeptidase family protein n=1 Tax=unclassified Acinetobacter TaxID=196816 RepID=UPI0035BA9A7A